MSILKIKALPYDLGPYCSESYGSEYMCRVGKTTAKGLAGLYPLPRMGEGITVAIPRLELANISGNYYLRHTDVPIRDWPQVFGIDVQSDTDQSNEAQS